MRTEERSEEERKGKEEGRGAMVNCETRKLAGRQRKGLRDGQRVMKKKKRKSKKKKKKKKGKTGGEGGCVITVCPVPGKYEGSGENK